MTPTGYTEAGYRLYDDTAMERLQQILLFRELEFPLKEIKHIIDSPDFDRNKALEQQIELLTMKKEHLERAYITDNFYECSDEILRNLRKMYASGGEFTENIDKAAGSGTAEFVANAIKDMRKNF